MTTLILNKKQHIFLYNILKNQYWIESFSFKVKDIISVVVDSNCCRTNKQLEMIQWVRNEYVRTVGLCGIRAGRVDLDNYIKINE